MKKTPHDIQQLGNVYLRQLGEKGRLGNDVVTQRKRNHFRVRLAT
jgi:hypothetical protein